jgi:hypothetical protein
LLLALAVMAQAPAAARMQPPPPPPAGRLTVVLGDLHMGVGRDASGAWDPREDFRWAEDLAAFLKAIDAQGRGATDLVLNGDTFELRQDAQRGCAYDDSGLGCTEDEALARFGRVLAAHAPEMAALGAFARSGSNRVVFVPGDHDAALLFPAVARRLVEVLTAPRAVVATSGYWASADGGIYVEHGHQLDFSADKFDSWPKPFVTRAGRTHLIRPWGEQLVQPFYDRHELAYPIVDNVSEEGAGVKFVLAAEGVADTGDDAPRWLRYFLSKMSWPQFRLDLDGGNAPAPTWDIAKVRGTGPAFLLASLPGDDRFKGPAAKAHEAGRFASLMSGLTDDEIVAICDYRAAIRRSRRRLERALNQLPGQGPAVTECPRTADTLGPAFEYFWRSRDLVITRRLAAVQAQLQNAGRPIAAFVFGHTHLPNNIRGQPGTIEKLSPGEVFVLFGFNPVRTSVTPVAINAGAWQRTVTPNQLDELRNDHGLSEQALLRAVRPEHLAPCYSFVEIAPYEGSPTPRTLYWRRSEKTGWEIATGCGMPPTVPVL